MPAPGLCATRVDGHWVVQEARSGARLPLSPLLDACLGAFEGGATRAAAQRALAAWPAAAVAALVEVLADLGLLVAVEASDDWRTWDAVAERFHFATRDVPVVARRTPRPPPPAPVRRHTALAHLPLDLPSVHADLASVLAARRTWRQLRDAPLSRGDLGTLLGVTFGIQGWADAPGAGWSALKTSPSGGARHSLEAYVLVRRAQDVPPGLYHYRPDRHGLDLLRRGCSARDLGRFLPGQDGYRRASVVCIMASVLARVVWRYGHARAYRVILIEAGHLAQTFALTATARGLASFSTGALADTALEDALGLSPDTCPVLYAVGAAPRPPGVAWAPYAHADAPARRSTRLGRHLARAPR